MRTLLASPGSWWPPLLVRLQRLGSNRWVRLGFLVLSLGFMALVMGSYWQDATSIQLSLRPGWLALSFLGVMPALLLETFLWRSLLGALGFGLAPRRSASLWFLSNLARYIPGNVWQFLGMMELGVVSGVPRPATMASVALHQVCSNLAGLLIGAPLLAAALGISAEVKLAVGAAVTALLGACLSPTVMSRLNRLLTRIARPARGTTCLSSLRLGVTLLGYCVYWLWVGTAFWALGRSLGISMGEPLSWASAFSASYVAGYLSLLTPSGLGVREGVLALLLATVAGPGAAAVAALVGRLWLSLAEVAMAAIAALADRGLVWSRGPETQP